MQCANDQNTSQNSVHTEKKALNQGHTDHLSTMDWTIQLEPQHLVQYAPSKTVLATWTFLQYVVTGFPNFTFTCQSIDCVHSRKQKNFCSQTANFVL